MTYQILKGNSLDLLPTLADNSIDAIVTDPPYGLGNPDPDYIIKAIQLWASGDRAHIPEGKGFMGKSWDSFVPPPAIWDECLRVLKPGGHLLAFAGTRTYDLMGISIRMAGFEIRDSIGWVYGSGFPKSLDVSKAIDKRRDDNSDIHTVVRWLECQRVASGVTRQQVEQHFGTTNIGQALFTITEGSSSRVATWKQWVELKSLLKFGDSMDAEVWRLNGRKGQPGEAWAEREVIGQKTAGMGSGKTFGMLQAEGNNAAAEKEIDITAPSTPEAKQWQGWGTALKPALEPIVVARKPLIGTVAENVLTHGTGGLNIDASRIGTEQTQTRIAGGKGFGSSFRDDGWIPPQENETRTNPLGRWPANLILSHAESCQPTGKTIKSKTGAGKRTATFGTQDTQSGGDGSGGWSGYEYETEVYECVEGCPVKTLDEQSGQLKSGELKAGRPVAHTNVDFMSGLDKHTYSSQANSGGASRFFYVAKASKRDRNEGLEELQDGDTPYRSHRPNFENTKGVETPFAGAGRSGQNLKNFHPTVKPTELMRYLVKLITPPGGTVLDPFTGSGSTGKAAILEGFDFIGIELTEDYWPIIEGRLKHAEAKVAERIKETSDQEQEKLF